MQGDILRSTPVTLELEVYLSGTLTDFDALPTLTITDGNGDTVTTGPVSTPATGIYRSTLSGQSDLKVLDAAWTGTIDGEAIILRQDYEIVGNHLFIEAEARTAPIVGQQTPFADTAKYADSYIARWRSIITETMEHRMNRGVIQRYCRAKFQGQYKPLNLRYGYPSLASGVPLNRPGRTWDVARIISATHDGEAIDTADLEVIDNYVYWTGETWTPGLSDESRLNVILEWEYGPDPVWAETHQRALDLLMANAIPKGYPSSATSISNEDGTFRITNFPVAVEEFFKKHNYR